MDIEEWNIVNDARYPDMLFFLATVFNLLSITT